MEGTGKRQITDMESCRRIGASSSERDAKGGGGCDILERKDPWLISRGSPSVRPRGKFSKEPIVEAAEVRSTS